MTWRLLTFALFSMYSLDCCDFDCKELLRGNCKISKVVTSLSLSLIFTLVLGFKSLLNYITSFGFRNNCKTLWISKYSWRIWASNGAEKNKKPAPPIQIGRTWFGASRWGTALLFHGKFLQCYRERFWHFFLQNPPSIWSIFSLLWRIWVNIVEIFHCSFSCIFRLVCMLAKNQKQLTCLCIFVS